MKNLLLTALITMSFSSVVSAMEVHTELCPMMFEENIRTSKVLPETPVVTTPATSTTENETALGN